MCVCARARAHDTIARACHHAPYGEWSRGVACALTLLPPLANDGAQLRLRRRGDDVDDEAHDDADDDGAPRGRGVAMSEPTVSADERFAA